MELLIALLISMTFAAPNAKSQASQSGAAAIPSQQTSNEITMNSCKTPKDCMKASTACGGVMAINKKFKKEWSAQVQKFKAANTCTEMTPEAKAMNKALRVACTKSFCELL